MLSNFAKFLLVATSIAPILVTFGIVELSQPDISWWRVVFYFALGAVLLLLCWAIVRVATAKMQRLPFRPASIKSADSEVVGFMVAYLLPLVTAGRPQLVILVGALCVVGVLVWGASAYHINPLLNLLGYKIYEVTDTDGATYLLLCKRGIRKAKELRNVVQLTDHMVLEVSDGIGSSCEHPGGSHGEGGEA